MTTSNPGPKLSTQIFATLQKVGRALMMPVSVLPAAGLLVAIGRLLQNYSQDAAGVIIHPNVQSLGKVVFSGGLAIFEQLSVVFAIGVAIGFTGGAGVAGLAAAVGYFTLTNVLKILSEVRGLELPINMGVFGGIIIGLITARLYHRFHQTKLHSVLGFFSGKRLVPIVTAGTAIVVGYALGYIWPPIQNGINAFGATIMNSELGPAFYAAGKRLLIPVGLHHVYYPPFLYEFGQFVTSAGQVVKGESARYFSGDPTAGRFMASEFPLMLFGLPAAALAMYLRAPSQKRKALAGVMLSAALTSIVTGITEPIEFSFIFVAPLLYGFHVVAAFFSGLLTSYFDIHLGYTFSASAIDYVLGFFNAKNSIYLFGVVGPIMAALYFGVFYYVIGALDVKTPGRDLEEDNGLANGAPAVEGTERSREILLALGGGSNIKHLDACITRLRLSVADGKLVDKVRLKQLGAAGILDAGGGNFQVIFGVESDHIKDEIHALMANGEANAVPQAQAGVVIHSPLKGKMLPLSEVPDETFAEKIMGDGFAIDPEDGVVYSPVAGQVAHIFRTNHAVGLITSEGVEILIHVGLDTVKMNGRGFKGLVKTGDQVKVGDRLIEFDLDLVRKEAKSTITPVVVTNMANVRRLDVLEQRQAIPGQDVMRVNL